MSMFRYKLIYEDRVIDREEFDNIESIIDRLKKLKIKFK